MVKTTKVNFDNMVKESGIITLLKLVKRCGKTWDLNVSNGDALMIVHQIQNLPTVTDFKWKLSQMQYVNDNTVEISNIITMTFYHKGKYRIITMTAENWLFATVKAVEIYRLPNKKKFRKFEKKSWQTKKNDV